MSWTTILLVAAGVVGLLVTVVIVAVVVLLVRTERLVKSAVPRLAALPCPACGVPIGTQTATALEAKRRAEGQRIWDEAKRKGTRIRATIRTGASPARPVEQRSGSIPVQPGTP